ncbi:MAG: winged helix-turn-helix transcriptional regulator [Planctomycetes bacterium]|nr:winged helix-turn-helix transcriptional regulator [Planctomycetota bacterium]
MTTTPDFPDAFGDWVDLLRRLLTGGRDLRRAFGRAASADELTDTEFLVIWACHCRGESGMAQCDLAETVGLSPAQISGLVEGLSVRGYVRPVGGMDRRRHLWRAAPHAVARVRSIAGRFDEMARAWDERISAEDRRTLIDLLARLADRREVGPRLPIVDREAA